jgi:hypothetical protein
MKRLIFISILVLYAWNSNCQVSIQANAKMMFSSYPTFEKFRTTFNDYQKWANIYKEDLKKFGTIAGSSFLASFFWEDIYADCGYGYITDRISVDYSTGFKRDFQLEINQIIFTIGYGRNYDRGGYCFYGGVESGVMRLRSTYYYDDESPSIGLDKASSRAFEGLPIKFSLGFKYFIPISDHIDITADIGYLTGGMKSGFDDLLDNNPILLSRNLLRNLPDDYLDYFNGGEYSGKFVQGDLKGFRIGIGLKFDLFDIDL